MDGINTEHQVLRQLPSPLALAHSEIENRAHSESKIGSDGRVEVHRARLRAVLGGRKTFPHGLGHERT
jgi:hypothetical protein